MMVRIPARGCAFVLAFLLCAPGLAVIPGTGNPQAFTEHDLRKSLLEFNRRTLVGAYEQFGRKNAKWDRQAEAFLERVSLMLAAAGAERLYRIPDAPSPADIEPLGRELLELGCDDPLVLDMFCIVLQDQGKLEEMRPLVLRASEQMRNSDYPKYRIANSVRRALRRIDARREPEPHRNYTQALYELHVQTIRETEFVDLDRRHIFATIAEDLAGWPLEQVASLYEDLRTGGGDEWMTNVIGGEFHIKNAWAARGNGWANNVTEDGWKKFAEELRSARTCLTDAYHLLPSHPEAALRMITVVMGGESGPDESLRTWFERAVEAQFDFEAAYDRYLHALQPRWQGSHREMHQFGLECMEAARYDTRVPMVLLKALERIRDDTQGNGWGYWRRPMVMDTLAEMLGEYAKASQHPEDRSHYLSLIVGYGWQVQRYDLGHSAIEQLDGNYNARALNQTGCIASRTASGTYAFTGPAAAKLEEAERFVAMGMIDKGIEIYRQAIDALQPDDRGSIWIRGRRQELVWQKQLNSFQPVDLMPDEHLSGWYVVNGTAKLEDGKILAEGSDHSGILLICGGKFGTDLELRAAITCLPAEGEHLDKATDAGLVVGWTAPNRYLSVLARPQADELVWTSPQFTEVDRRPVEPTSHFNIRMLGGLTVVSVDRKGFMPAQQQRLQSTPDGRIGIWSSAAASKVKIAVESIEVRLPGRRTR